MKLTTLAFAAAPIALLLAACGGGGDDGTATATPAGSGASTGASASATPSGTIAGLDPADFSATIDNPFAPFDVRKVLIYEGEETNSDGETVQTRDEMNVLPATDTIAGVEVLVVKDEAFEDGELVESTLDYFAQDKSGDVYYFGEDVDTYENGEIKDHTGSWRAGEGENQPGVYMPADRSEGLVFEQEKAPGIAQDQTTIVSLDQAVSVPAGDFTGCIKTDDYDPIANDHETKYYCPNVGFVREEFEGGHLDLTLY